MDERVVPLFVGLMGGTVLSGSIFCFFVPYSLFPGEIVLPGAFLGASSQTLLSATQNCSENNRITLAITEVMNRVEELPHGHVNFF